MLTNSELNQIKDFLALYGKKDSQLELATSLEGGVDNIYVSIVQGGKNYRITLRLLEEAVIEGLINGDIIDVIDNTPIQNSNNLVTSDGIWHAINDDNIINTNQIIESAVTTSKISDNAIISSKLANDSVTTNKLENNAVTGDKINDDSITTSKISNLNVTTEKIANSNVTTEKLADEAVTFNKLANEVNGDFATLHSETERFAVTLKSNGSTTINKEITGAVFSAPLTTTNEIEVFGDAGSSTVVPKSASFSTNGGTIVEGNPTTWNLPNTVGSYTATYTAISRSDIQKSASINANVYLRKYFGFSASEPVDITALGTSHASATVSCTVTIPINGTGYKYIYLAVPYNMSITGVVQPDALNAPLAITFVKNINRTINGQNYSYKLYRSEDTIDSSERKRLTIS